MKRPLTREQRIAKQIVELTNDVTLDLDDVGKTIANAHPTMSYNRIILIAESAVEEKQTAHSHLSLDEHLMKEGY